MESFDSSIEPRTLCSAALSCGGVRSPGRPGRAPGSYAAGPSPQSSPTLSRGGSGTPGTSHDPCSVMLTLSAPLPSPVPHAPGGCDACDARGDRRQRPGATPGTCRRPSGPIRSDPPRRESRPPGGAGGRTLSTGAGDNLGRDVDDRHLAVTEAVDNMWRTPAI